MPIPAPEAWENAIPPYGIRAAKPTAQALKIPIALDRIARDVSTALQEFGLPPVVSSQTIAAASAAARDAHWGVPANATQRLALQTLGASTIRTDLHMTERYYAALADGGGNPGGRNVAGWYPVQPFAFESGIVDAPAASNGAYAPIYYGSPGVNFAFETGHFTVPPIVTYSAIGAGVLWATASAPPTVAGGQGTVLRLGAALSAGTKIQWTATQRTPTEA